MRCCFSDLLLGGPGKFVRLFLFGFLIPVLLISLILYVRLILLPPQLYSMAPTDQRLLNHKSSSFWCKAQLVRMNGSFNAYLVKEAPTTSKYFSTHTMKKHLTLKDDVKEYWGFFLEKGSIVTFNLCSRYGDSALLIMKGAHNLQRCAWLGRKDLAEQNEDGEDDEDESGEPPEVYYETPPTLAKETINGMEIGRMTSAERKHNLEYYADKMLRLSKDQKEIVEVLNENGSYISLKKNSNSESFKFMETSSLNKLSRVHVVNKTKLERLKRTLEKNIDEEAYNVLNDGTIYGNTEGFQNNSSMETDPARIERLKFYQLPSGLTYERSKVSQIYDQKSITEEESDSNSEEVLANCSGILGRIPLLQNQQCYSFYDTHFNRITYKTPSSGTYYFVFANDNEFIDAKMYINMTLQKVVFDTENATNSCHNETSCSLTFSFWSDDQTIVEVPEGNWDSAYTLEVICKPRVSVYLGILLFIPVIFVFCALQ